MFRSLSDYAKKLYEKQRKEDVDKGVNGFGFFSKNADYFWNLHSHSIKKWTEEDFKSDPGFKKVVDEKIADLNINTSWKKHKGEIMFNAKQYYLVNFVTLRMDKKIKEFLDAIEIKNYDKDILR